jgi:hypothetical protein
MPASPKSRAHTPPGEGIESPRPSRKMQDDPCNNVLALALGILIVILVAVGSIFIMANLNENMLPSPELMNLHMQH